MTAVGYPVPVGRTGQRREVRPSTQTAIQIQPDPNAGRLKWPGHSRLNWTILLGQLARNFEVVIESGPRWTCVKENTTMKITLTFAATTSALATAFVVSVPAAVAAPIPQPKACALSVAGSTCESPGNVEINIPRNAVEFHPYGNMPYLLGGH